jgi:hypothetical protein
VTTGGFQLHGKDEMMIYGSQKNLAYFFACYTLAMSERFAWKSILVTLLTLMAASV